MVEATGLMRQIMAAAEEAETVYRIQRLEVPVAAVAMALLVLTQSIMVLVVMVAMALLPLQV